MTALCALRMVLVAMLCGAASDGLPLQPPKHGGVYVVAHRGAHEGIPENTLAAYRKAIELGVDFVEIDVRTTKDGRFVSVHNDSVDAYCKDGTTGRVKELTLAELKALDIGSRVGPEWADERIPTFEEILDLCKGKCGIYLDLKDAPVEPLVKLIRDRGMEHDVLWYTWGIKRLKRACPECIEMPDPGPEKNLPKLIASLQPRVIAAVWRHYSKSFVDTCHAAGAIVIVDESNPLCWKDALAWGSDGVQTDHPEAFIEFLKTHNGSAPAATN